MAVAFQLLFKMTTAPVATGWSETYYVDGLSAGVLAFSAARYTSLLTRRLQCLGQGVQHVGSRVTDIIAGRPPVNPFGRATDTKEGTDFPGTAPVYNAALLGLETDFAGTAQRIQCQTANVNGIVYKKNFYMSGIPDVYDVSSFNAPLAGPYSTALNTFTAYLRVANTGFIMVVNDRSVNNPKRPCTAYDAVTKRLTVVGHTLLEGQVAEALGWKGVQNGVIPRGSYRVHVIDADTIELRGAQAFSGILTLGYIRPISYLHLPVNNVYDSGFTTKKRGAPPIRSRGRRRTPLSRRA